MEESERPLEPSGANHLCVLVHGLWGNPSHLESLATALQEKYGSDQLHVLAATKNSDSFTYDGIEVGGERLAQEVETELERLEQMGSKITKFSIVGYSLGGLIARYCVGLLYSRKVFVKIQPINFNTFASPHLGVRTPVQGYHSSIWNAIAGRTLSTSGRQLFLIDSFRDTGRPLLSVLADSSSIFIKALASFKHRALYANIVNDRSAPWFTTGISATDPFVDLSNIDMHYVDGYGSVILDPDRPATRKTEKLDYYTRLVNGGYSFMTGLPLMALLTVLVPVGTTVFLVNSGYQTIRSAQRVRLHEEGKAGLSFSDYRIPLMLENALDTVGVGQGQKYLEDDKVDAADRNGVTDQTSMKAIVQRNKGSSEFPTLALASEQFAMIDGLDRLGWRKYPVYISLVRHSHAAIIVRWKREAFKEGYIVMKHWLNEVFEI